MLSSFLTLYRVVQGHNAVIISWPCQASSALVAFVAEHQRCGDLDGGRDDGYVWLQCSCGGLIMQPVSEPPKAPAVAQ
jgi:hypothetical protein